MYRTRLSGQQVALCGALEGLLLPSDAHLGWAAIPVLLDQPLGVVAGDEGPDSVTHVLDGLEDATMDGLLFQGSEQPLDHAVGLGFRDEGIARHQAPELDLLLEDVGHEIAAVVVAQRQAAGSTGAEMDELLAHRHAEGLDRLVAGAVFCHVPAEQIGLPVLGDAEQPDLAVRDGGDLGGVGGPHDVRRFGGDVPLVRRLRPRSGPVRREQGVLAHQPQHPLARDPDTVHRSQSGPDLAVTLTGPRRAGEVSADSGQQVRIGDGRLRATACWARSRPGLRRARLLRGVERGPRDLPDLADPRDTVAAAGGCGGHGGHHRDLLRAKGPGRSILARSSSISIESSLIRCMAATSWPSAGSVSRSFSAPSSAASAFCRHCSSLNSGRPSSRESSSAASPRSSRSTTSRLRAALQRWLGPSGPRAAPPLVAGALWPGDSVDGRRPPSLITGPSTAAAVRSISFILDFTMAGSSDKGVSKKAGGSS